MKFQMSVRKFCCNARPNSAFVTKFVVFNINNNEMPVCKEKDKVFNIHIRTILNRRGLKSILVRLITKERL